MTLSFLSGGLYAEVAYVLVPQELGDDMFVVSSCYVLGKFVIQQQATKRLR